MSNAINHPRAAELARRAVAHLLNHLLPFWCGPAVDHENGGWMAWLANDLTPDRTQPKGVIVHSRILWAFSAAYRVYPRPEFAAMARRAYDFLTGKFWDAQHGGLFWRLAASQSETIRACLKMTNWRQDAARTRRLEACATAVAQASCLRVHGASQLGVPCRLSAMRLGRANSTG